MSRALALGVAAWCVASSAVAAPRNSVHVAPPVLEGGSAEHVASALEQSVRAGLADAGVDAVAPPEGCGDADCMASASAQGASQGLLLSSVRIEGSDYRLSVEIRDGDGSVLARREGSCEICTYDEASEALRGLVATAAGELAPAPTITTATVRVSSRPAGATVLVDGATVGTTPYEGQLPAGVHLVEVRKAGHEAQRREIELGSEGAVVDVELRRADKLSPRTLELVGWSALGVGVAALGAGIALLVLDSNPVKNNCTGMHIDGDGDCEFRYDTLGGGIGLTVAGVAGIGAGTGLVIVARKRRGGTPAETALGAGGVRVRF